MNKEEVEELISDLKEQINFVKQYRILTNKLCNNHISDYDRENFKKEEGIYYTDNKLFDDYEYDLYNFISIKDWENSVQELERYKNIIDEIERYFIDMFNRTQDTKYLDDLQKLKKLKERNKIDE